MVDSIKSFPNVDEHPTEKHVFWPYWYGWFLPRQARWVECAWRKPYWDEDNSWCFSMKTFILLYIYIFLILLKFDKNKIDLYLQASVSSSAF